MEDHLFNTPEKKLQAIATLETGVISPFWELLKKVLEENLRVARLQLEDGLEDETPIETNKIRERIRAYKDLLATPTNLIKNLAVQDNEVVSDDPYDQMPEVDKEEK